VDLKSALFDGRARMTIVIALHDKMANFNFRITSSVLIGMFRVPGQWGVGVCNFSSFFFRFSAGKFPFSVAHTIQSTIPHTHTPHIVHGIGVVATACILTLGKRKRKGEERKKGTEAAG
jgi:hypothetical protein